LAINKLLAAGDIRENPIKQNVAAISVGIYNGVPVLDLDYAEDSVAETDMNIVMASNGTFIELQGTAEAEPFTEAELATMMNLAKKGIEEIIALQNEVLANQ